MPRNNTRVPLATPAHLVTQLQLAATACSEKDQKANLLSREVLSRGVAAVRRIVKRAEHYHDGLLISLNLLELAQDRATKDAGRCAELKRQIDSHRCALAATQLRHQQLGAVRACDAQQQAAKQCELSVLQSRLDATTAQRPSWWQELASGKAWRAWIAQRRQIQRHIEETRRQRDIHAAGSHTAYAQQTEMECSMASLDASLANQEDELAALLRLSSTARGIPPDGDFRRYASVLSDAIKNCQQFEATLATAEHCTRSNRWRRWLKAALVA